jgi:hypothetical protein
VHVPASILGVDEASDSIFDAFGTKDDENGNSFEAVILNSKIYSTTFTGVLGPTSNDDDDNDDDVDARTIVSAGSAKQVISPVYIMRAGITDVRPGIILVDVPDIKPCLLRLGIISIYAYIKVSHGARSGSELSLESGQYIHHLQQVTESRFYGQLKANHTRSIGDWGYFDRNKVIFMYSFRRPLELRTITASTKPLSGHYLRYDNGEILKFWVSPDASHSIILPLIDYKDIRHTTLWWAERQNHTKSGGVHSGYVNILDLELEGSRRQDIDRILEYFSYPMPELAALSKSAKLSRMCSMVQSGTCAEVTAINAHCNSVEDLRHSASERRKRMGS